MSGGGRLKPFQKGQSGNPSGYWTPQKLSAYNLVRKMCSDVSEETTLKLIALTSDPDSRVAMVAIKEVLERAAGAPRDHSDEDRTQRFDLSKLAKEERDALAAILQKMSGKEGD